ncbi:ArsC family reductase [Pontixanthobacter gangjinensis]|uniref:Spx/MgsR family RNA polymerase-binding regulatory protein n=1 Tax=Pontixanthobacter gangjinensis TaxID=1028742 RepID=A0A6I4SIH1_9SPHN|nr:arsenate reductase [Pontixanthobacter gangjinensis]MXO55403.1 Spx/MgsR family RNA polymerase-binding regulatory protein [Pontixanthobacter gangjinensis]
MSVDLYGIPNCDTVKKARKWLDTNGVDYVFHDYKKEGADPAKLTAWIADKGVDVVLNRRGTTFRKLSDAQKAGIDAAKAVTLLQEHPSMIKRPVAEYTRGSGGTLVGFKEDEWSAAFL